MRRTRATLVILIALSTAWAGCKSPEPDGGAQTGAQTAAGIPAGPETNNAQAPDPAAQAPGDGVTTGDLGTTAGDPAAQAGTAAQAVGVAPDPGVAPAPDEGAPLLTRLPVLARLPQDSVGVVAVASPRAFLDWSGLEALRRTYAPMLGEVSQELVREIGQDLLDPAAYERMGIDLNAPGGVAWVSTGDDEEENGFAFFVTLSDRDRLVAEIFNMAGRVGGRLDKETYGDVLVIHEPSHHLFSLVITPEHAYAVTHIDAGVRNAEVARAIALEDGQGGLAAAARFQAVAGLAGTPDVAVYLDPTQLHGLAMNRIEERLNRGRAEVKAQETALAGVADARRRQELERELNWGRRSLQRREAEKTLADMLLGDLNALVLGGRMAPEGLRLSGQLTHDSDAFWARLLTAHGGPAPVFHALDSGPFLLFAGRAESTASVELLEAMLRVDGEDPTEFRATLKRELGVDLDADVIAALTGAVGLALPLDANVVLRSRDMGFDDQDGLIRLVAGVKDAGQAAGTLARVVAPHLPAVAGAPGAFSLPGTPLQVAVAGDAVVLGSADALQGLAGSTPGVLEAHVADAGLRAALAHPDNAALMLVDSLFLGMPVVYGMGYMYEHSVAAMAHEASGGAALTPAQRQRLAEVEAKLEQARSAAQEADWAVEREQRGLKLAAIGQPFVGKAQLGLAAREHDGALRFEGGFIATSGDLAGTIAALVPALVLADSLPVAGPTLHAAREAEAKARATVAALEAERQAVLAGQDPAPAPIPTPGPGAPSPGPDGAIRMPPQPIDVSPDGSGPSRVPVFEPAPVEEPGQPQGEAPGQPQVAPSAP